MAELNAEVREVSAKQAEMLARIQLPLTLMGGTTAMRHAETEYLPQEPKETGQAYRIRLSGSVLFNAYGHTVGTLVGKPFKEPIQWDNQLPPEFEAWFNNIDLTGRTMSEFLAQVFEDSINCGLSHILVEFPNVPPLNAAAERQVGARPYWVHVKEKNVLGWRSEIIGGQQRLTQFRILEQVTVNTGRWGDVEAEQVRVLYAGRPAIDGFEQQPTKWETWIPDGEGKKEWIKSGEGFYPTLTEIPVVTAYTNRTEFMMGKPPLTDLADVNVSHWRSYSDQRHILHVARVPILFGTGLGDTESSEPFEVSPNSVTLGEEGSDLKYVEHSGAAIGSGRDDLSDLEDRMASLGAEALTMMKFGTRGTATEVAEVSSESDAALGGWIKLLNKAAQEAWDLMHRYQGRDPVGLLTISDETGPATKDPNAGANILAYRNAGLITRHTALTEAQAQGIFVTEFDPQDELENVDNEVPPSVPTSPPPPMIPQDPNAPDKTAPPNKNTSNGQV